MTTIPTEPAARPAAQHWGPLAGEVWCDDEGTLLYRAEDGWLMFGGDYPIDRAPLHRVFDTSGNYLLVGPLPFPQVTETGYS